jgi:hypothetical protein
VLTVKQVRLFCGQRRFHERLHFLVVQVALDEMIVAEVDDSARQPAGALSHVNASREDLRVFKDRITIPARKQLALSAPADNS